MQDQIYLQIANFRFRFFLFLPAFIFQNWLFKQNQDYHQSVKQFGSKSRSDQGMPDI